MGLRDVCLKLKFKVTANRRLKEAPVDWGLNIGVKKMTKTKPPLSG